MTDTAHTLDINAAFRGGRRPIEWPDDINKAPVVTPAGAAIVPRDEDPR